MTNPGWGGGAPEPQDPRSSTGSDPWAQPPQAPGHGQGPQPGGGQGPQPGSAPWQGPAGSPAQPSPAGQQPSPGYGSPAYGASSGPGGFGPSGPGGFGPSGPGGPGGVGPTGPSGPGGEQPPSKKPWALIVGAIACIGLLVLGVAGGIGFLALNDRGGGETTATSDATTEEPSEDPTSEDPTTDPTTSEGPGFEVIPAYDTPPGTTEELTAILADNPLTSGDLPDIGSCDLPPTPQNPNAEQLQAVLDASAGCLNQVWSAASSNRGLPWRNPTVTVYEHPTLPNSPCADDPTDFGPDHATVCNLDTSIYWPLGYGTGTAFSDESIIVQAYLWDLSYSYTNTLLWNSSLTVYYVTMMTEYRDSGDTDAYDEAFLRWDLQRTCLTLAAIGQLPADAQPSGTFRDQLFDEATWPEQGERPVSSANKVRWLRAGFESGGDLSKCNTWAAPLDQVN